MRPNETPEEFEARVTARAMEMDLVPGTLAWDAMRLDMALSDAGQTLKTAARRDWQRLVTALAPILTPFMDWLARRLSK